MNTRLSIRRIPTLAALAFFVAASVGCASSGGKFRPDAFGGNKTYAVVSVMSTGKVECGEPTGNPCNMGIVGLVNTLTTANAAYREDAAPTLELASPAVMETLRRLPNLKLVSDARTLAAYRSAKPDEQPTGMLAPAYLVAKGFKYFSNERLARLASDLKVDGVIVVKLDFMALRSGMPVLGFGGGHAARTGVQITGVDKLGQVVWDDRASAKSEESAGSVAGGVDFPRLRPLFVGATEKAVKQLIDSAAAQAGKT